MKVRNKFSVYDDFDKVDTDSQREYFDFNFKTNKRRKRDDYRKNVRYD
jgi:hypothetical protein